MNNFSMVIKFKKKKPVLLNPVTDDQQRIINERVDRACSIRLDMQPTDPRAIAYVRAALWLWQ
jgi:hypothetical protein